MYLEHFIYFSWDLYFVKAINFNFLKNIIFSLNMHLFYIFNVIDISWQLVPFDTSYLMCMSKLSFMHEVLSLNLVEYL